MTLRELTIASAVAAALGLGGQALAQQRAQEVNPSPMPPGSRAGQAPGMNPTGQAAQQGQAPATSGTATPRTQGSPQTTGPGQGTSAGAMNQPVPGPTTAQGPNTPDRGVPGGTGAQAPSAQPDVGRGTAPPPGTAQTGQGRDPGMAPGGATTGTTGGATTTQGTGATTPGPTTTQGGGRDTTPPAATTQHTEPRTGAAPVAGANSFTEGQARARMADAGFNDVQELRLDEQGIWRGRAMRGGQQTGVALDYQGNVTATPR